jgi:glycosyltransferase involved in cell wall biosynthesis
MTGPPSAQCRAFGVCMRTLVVAYEYPWPANSGSRLRLLTTLHGLCRAGPTELFSITSVKRVDFDDVDPSLGLSKAGRVAFRPGGVAWGTIARPWFPAAVSIRDRGRVTRALAQFTTGSYDLVWCFDVRAWVLAGASDLAPAVLDVDDLEHYKIQGRLRVDSLDAVPDMTTDGGHRANAISGLKRLPGRSFSRLEARRWARLYRSASTQAVRTIVCSQLDADRATSSGMQRVSVVPNAYPRPDRPAGRPEVGSPPLVLFHGTLRYPPNADAARWLVGRIGPALRTLVPEASIRLVGLANPEQVSLHDPPRTTLVGPVADIVTELRRADLVVVPVRFGSGTRVKILEAFAHRVPVVSTTLGAEGLGVVDGQHLLLADSAEGLAMACARLLTEPDLRQRLVDAAYEHYLDAFDREVVEKRIAALARAVVAAAAHPAT